MIINRKPCDVHWSEWLELLDALTWSRDYKSKYSYRNNYIFEKDPNFYEIKHPTTQKRFVFRHDWSYVAVFNLMNDEEVSIRPMPFFEKLADLEIITVSPKPKQPSLFQKIIDFLEPNL